MAGIVGRFTVVPTWRPEPLPRLVHCDTEAARRSATPGACRSRSPSFVERTADTPWRVLPPVRFPAQGQGPKIRALLRSNQPTSENEDDPQEHDLPLVRRHRARSRDLLCRNLPGQRRGGGPPRAGGFSVRQAGRSEEHTSELQSLMRISYAVFCLKKKNQITKRQ